MKKNQSPSVKATLGLTFVKLSLRHLDNFLKKRFYIFREILETEEKYLNGINQLIEDVYNPLLKAVGTEQQILTTQQIDEIFPMDCINIIKQLNTDFKENLSKKLKTFSPYMTIGDLFVLFSKSLRIYTVYVEKYDRMTEVLCEVGRQEPFRKLMQVVFGVVDATLLEGLLVTPIQRVPRYQLLLQQLLKYTWETHPDYTNIKTSLDNIKETAMFINDKSKEASSYRKLLAVQNTIIGMKNEVIDPQRRFVKDGFLFQLLKGKWKKRHFFLFNDRLIRTKESSKGEKTYSFLDKVTLRQVEVIRNVKLSSKGELNSQKKKLIENSFCIKHPHPIEFIVSADSIEEKEEWINKLVLNIKICQDNFEFNREIKRRVSTARAKVAKEYFGEKYSTEYISNFHNTFQKSKEGRRKKFT